MKKSLAPEPDPEQTQYISVDRKQEKLLFFPLFLWRGAGEHFTYRDQRGEAMWPAIDID